MQALYVITALLLLASLAVSPAKTGRALRVALKRFLKVAPAFLVMLVCIAVVLYLVPDDLLTRALARDSKWYAVASGLGLGSISIMPGFIAFPLCGILLEHGALYMVLSAFSTAVMMVGVVTYPLERAYLGVRLTLCRNAVAFLIAAAVALVTGLVFGEVP